MDANLTSLPSLKGKGRAPDCDSDDGADNDEFSQMQLPAIVADRGLARRRIVNGAPAAGTASAGAPQATRGAWKSK